MNNLLSICSEFSDNVWYGEFGAEKMPSKIAIELESEFKNVFLKLIRRHGYRLDKSINYDSNSCVLTLKKSKSIIFAN